MQSGDTVKLTGEAALRRLSVIDPLRLSPEDLVCSENASVTDWIEKQPTEHASVSVSVSAIETARETVQVINEEGREKKRKLFTAIFPISNTNDVTLKTRRQGTRTRQRAGARS